MTGPVVPVAVTIVPCGDPGPHETHLWRPEPSFLHGEKRCPGVPAPSGSAVDARMVPAAAIEAAAKAVIEKVFPTHTGALDTVRSVLARALVAEHQTDAPPNHLLSEEVRLTDEEAETIRRHAYAGSYSRERADRYVREVEAIVASRTEPLRAEVERLAALRERVAETVEPWPFGTDAACQLIAAASWPNEHVEDRDRWAVTMPKRPWLLSIEVKRARERLEQAIAHVAAALGGEG